MWLIVVNALLSWGIWEFQYTMPNNGYVFPLLFIPLLWGYTLPSIIGFLRRLPHRWPLFLGNTLLGWTFFIWVVCLIVSIWPNERREVEENF